MTVITDMLQLETDLRDSINAYNQIFVLLTHIGDKLGTASQDELLVMNATLESLQGQATQRDQSIMERLQKLSAKNDTLEALLKGHGIVIKEILVLNDSVTAKAMAVKSHIAHEIGTLHSGISMIKGYNQHGNEQGRIINRSS